MRALHWLAAMNQDPDGSPSSTRWLGSLCIVVACGCAIGGVCLGRADAAAIVVAIGGVGSSCLFARTKSSTTPDNSNAAGAA